MTPPPRAPGVGIGVLLPHPEHPTQFLLGLRVGAIGENTWALPGGHLEFGESFADCAIRETAEETGLIIEAASCVVVGTTNTVWEDPKAQDGKAHYVTVFVRAKIVGDRDGDGFPTPRILEPHKCKEWKWMEWNDVQRWALEQVSEGQSDITKVKRKDKLFPAIINLFTQVPHASLR